MTHHEYTEGGYDMVKDQEKEHGYEVTFVDLAPTGFGFGEGSISVRSQLENPEISQLTPEALRIGMEIIKSDVAFVEVDPDAHDDGCGDGRPTEIVYKVDGPYGERQEFRKSRRRAKVFSGGLVTASSMYRTVLGGEIQPGETVLGDRRIVADLLDDMDVKYGGHTDNHAHGDMCGCGAIDKYPAITVNALKFRDEITGLLQGVYGEEEFQRRYDAINDVFASYQDQVQNASEYFKDAAGVNTIKLMEDHGSVIKQLANDHLEDFVVVNDIEGTTFDQRAFDEEMRRRGVEGTAQAFVVDSWRGRMYASLIADIAHERGMDYEQAYYKAEADFWIRTLAVSGTLTAGDLPAVLRTKKDYDLAA